MIMGIKVVDYENLLAEVGFPTDYGKEGWPTRFRAAQEAAWKLAVKRGLVSVTDALRDDIAKRLMVTHPIWDVVNTDVAHYVLTVNGSTSSAVGVAQHATVTWNGHTYRYNPRTRRLTLDLE